MNTTPETHEPTRAESWWEFYRSDPVTQIPYDERTVNQLIATWALVNPAFKAWSQYVPSDVPQACLTMNAAFYGVGEHEVPSANVRRALEELLDVLAAGAIRADVYGVEAMTREERIEWRRRDGLRQAQELRRTQAARIAELERL